MTLSSTCHPVREEEEKQGRGRRKREKREQCLENVHKASDCYYSRNTLTITLAAEDSFMIMSCLSPPVALRYCKTGALLGDFERSEVTKAHSVLSRNEKAVNFREKEGVSR